MSREAETGVMLPHSRECQGLPKAGRDKEGSTPRDSGENITLANILISDF